AVAYTDSFKAGEFTFYGGHCTGGRTIEYFRERYGDKVVMSLGSGLVIEY
ncbi:MAG: MBL fold metallo-hydrolase, partial [Deltaproteobacteria bacterium]|nr:MBL fold metallo-hydrolase [Deltaproteobacteria bacterium]